MSIIELNDSNYREIIKDSSKPAVIDFYATWCGPCKAMGIHFNKLAEENSDKILFCKADVEQCESVTQELGIMNLPCIISYKNGDEVNRIAGNQIMKVSEMICSL